MKEKVSVVVPAYNAEKTLEKCLLSLQAQDYTNIQVIVVVDGATDRTEEIAAAFSEKDARFSYVVQPNGGLSAARNHGMRLATGEYVACVDSDDYVDPDFLRTLVCAIGDGEVAVSGVLSETETGEELRRTHFSAGVFTGEELLDRMLLSDNEIGGFACNKMYRRSFLQDNGLLFFEGKNLTFEDIDFSCRALKKVKKGSCAASHGYHYVQFKNTGMIRGLGNAEKWLHYTDLLNRMLEEDDPAHEAFLNKLKIETTWHCATAVRALAHFEKTDTDEYKRMKRFLTKMMPKFLCCRILPLKKRLGGLLTMFCPKAAFRLWNRNRGG